MNSIKKQKRIDTDNKIKAAALEVFTQYGYERTSLKKIADLAGISNGLIVQNFDSKEGLFMSIVDEGYACLEKYFNDFGKDQSWEFYLVCLVELFKNCMKTEENRKIVDFITTISNSKDTPKTFREKSHNNIENNPVFDAIVKGQEKGEIKDGDPVLIYGIYFKTTVNLIMSCYRCNIDYPDNEWFLTLIKK